MYIQKIGAETVVARGVLYGCVLYVHTKIGAETVYCPNGSLFTGLYVHTKIGAETVQRLDGLVALACMYIQK